ncbi:hypothetical protein EMIHUDRAFT_251268, partial [Emiliania huxleyi CCMP1516]
MWQLHSDARPPRCVTPTVDSPVLLGRASHPDMRSCVSREHATLSPAPDGDGKLLLTSIGHAETGVRGSAGAPWVWLQRGESSTVSDGFEIALSRGKAPSRRSPLPEEPDAAVVLRLLRQPPPAAAEASTASGTAPLALTADDEGLTEAFGKARPYRMLDGRTTALFTSYGTDYSFLAEMVAGSPAAARRRGVTVVDNYDHHRTPAGLDEHTYTVHNAAVRANFSVVLPPFFSDDTAAADRTRVHHGTMHPKMWLLEFSEGGACGSGFLRLAISSANLGRYDAKINNQVWACDFVRAQDAVEAARALGVSQLKAELKERRVDAAGCSEKAELAERLVEARRADSAGFGADLLFFVERLVGRAAPELFRQWEALLSRYDLTPPAGTHLIFSAPGRYSGPEAERYGLRALQRHLKVLSDRPVAQRPTAVEYACSSLGQLDDILQPLLGVRPNYKQAPRMAVRGAFLEGLHKPPHGAAARLVWPSLTASLPAFARGKGMLTIGGGKNTMTGPSEFKSQQLKACMAHNIAADPRRSATLHHVKMAAGIVRPLQREGPQREVAPLCAWVYAGSHNLSGAAWGKMEAATGSDDESGVEDEEFVVMSYEVGVLLLPPEPRPFALPWVTAAAPYDPTE